MRQDGDIKIPAEPNTSKPLCYRRVYDDDPSCTKAHLPYNSSTQSKYPRLLTTTRWQFAEPISFLRRHHLSDVRAVLKKQYLVLYLEVRKLSQSPVNYFIFISSLSR